MEALISVIVPVYNTEKYIERCVKSICNQSYHNLEIILVDDGSKDASGRICDQLAVEDSRIRVIHQPNAGVSSARNAGIEAAGGYITFADSDDYLHPRMIERLHTVLKENEADISSCEYTSDEPELSVNEAEISLIFDTVNGISDMLCNKNITYAVNGKLFLRSTVNGVRFHTEYSHNEDLLFCYEAFLRSKRIAHTKEKLYLYYTNETSATRVAFSHKRMTAIDVQERILQDIEDRFLNTGLPKTARQQFLKVNIYTGMQMAEANYMNKPDRQRIRSNIRKFLPDLIMKNLALGYKVNGCLLAYNPTFISDKSTRK